MSNLCKNGIDKSIGIIAKLVCSIDNQNCCYTRWCNDKRCLKMIPSYLQCRNLNVEVIDGSNK